LKQAAYVSSATKEPTMSSEASTRKSRLTVPAGGDGLSPPPSRGAPGVLPVPPPAHHNHHHLGGMLLSSPTGPLGMGGSSSAAAQYLSRLTDIQQMDIQSALDQMRHLLSTRPQVVYKTCYYRKQTKNVWARDDPAFCALQAVFLVIAVVAHSVAFRISLSGFVSFLLYTLLWNWLGMGLLLATLCREIANRHLVTHQSASHVRQQVEWLYAFDIHCNSFFPVFVLLCKWSCGLDCIGLLLSLFAHLTSSTICELPDLCADVVQFFLIPVVLGEGLVPMIIANSLYAAALSWYWYITHLGYRTLPFLSNTEVFLFPIAAVLLVFVVMLIGYPFNFGWNAARVMARFYFE
jgi:UNC-50 family